MKHIDNIKSGILNFRALKIFRNEHKLALLNIETGAIYEIDEPTAELLSVSNTTYAETYDRFKETWSQESFNELLEQLAGASLLAVEGGVSSTQNVCENHEFSINILTIFVAQECNLHCTYCYGDAGEYSNKGRLNINRAKKAVDFLFDNSHTRKEVCIAFFGGEPLLEFGLIKETVAYAKEQAKEYNKIVSFSLTTNGTLMTDEITDFIRDNKFSITLSIDGEEKVHDANRFFEDKSGSYNEVLKCTENIRKNYKVSARATITNKGLDVSSSFDHLAGLGFNSIKMSPCVGMLSDEDYDILIENNNKFINKFMTYVKDKEYDKAFKMTDVFSVLNKIHSGGTRAKFCGAGNNMLAVDVDGSIFICHRFVSDQEHMLGNIYDGLNELKYKKYMDDMLNRGSDICRECWAVNICGGGCPYENWEKNKSVRKPYHNYCKMMRSFIEKLIFSYMELTQEQKDVLFSKSKTPAAKAADSL